MKKIFFLLTSCLLASTLLSGCGVTPFIIEISVPTRTLAPSARPTALKPLSPAATTAPTSTPLKPASKPTRTLTPVKASEATHEQPSNPVTITLHPFSGGNAFVVPVTITLTGTVTPVPFEKQMAYQIYNAQNQLIGQGPVMVSGEYGAEGTFSVDIPFKETQTGDFTIKVLDASAKDGSILASAETQVTLQAQAADRMVITLDPLKDGDTYTAPATVHVSGRVSIMPFEKTLAYQVYDSGGQLVTQGSIPVAGEYGSMGAFAFDVRFTKLQTGMFTIRVVNFSPKDGSATASAMVMVKVK